MSELVCEGGGGPEGPLSLAMLQETRRDNVPSFGKWCVHTCPPGPNIGEGESAGVFAMASIHLAHTPITPHLPPSLVPVAGDNVSGVLVRLQGVDILCLTVYMACTIHLSGANVHRLNTIERVIRYFDIPFIFRRGFQYGA